MPPSTHHLLPRPFSTGPIIRRSFFTLPDLSKLSPFSQPDGPSPAPQTYNERKILPYVFRLLLVWQTINGLRLPSCRYKPSQLYDVVTDVESYPKFLPFCASARVLSRVPASADKPLSMQAEMSVGFLSFKESYVSDVICFPKRSVEVRYPLSRRHFCILSFVMIRLLPPLRLRCFER